MSRKRGFSVREITTEFMVGLFFFGALTILGLFTIVLGEDQLGGDVHRVEVKFATVAGLSEGDSVLMRGVHVGSVEALDLTPSYVLVTLKLNRPVELYEKYSVKIQYSSMLGGRIVVIDPGDTTAATVPANNIEGEAPSDLMSEAAETMRTIRTEVADLKDFIREGDLVTKATALIQDLQGLTQGVKDGKGTVGKLMQDETLYTEAKEGFASLRQAGDEVSSAADQFKALAANVRDGKGTLGKLASDPALYDDVAAVARSLRQAEGTLGRLIMHDDIYDDIADTVASLKRVSQNMADSNSTLGRVMADDGQLYDSLKATVDGTNAAIADVRSGKGTLGKLVSDPELYDTTLETVKTAQTVLEDLREQAPVSTFSSVVFGSL